MQDMPAAVQPDADNRAQPVFRYLEVEPSLSPRSLCSPVSPGCRSRSGSEPSTPSGLGSGRGNTTAALADGLNRLGHGSSSGSSTRLPVRSGEEHQQEQERSGERRQRYTDRRLAKPLDTVGEAAVARRHRGVAEPRRGLRSSSPTSSGGNDNVDPGTSSRSGCPPGWNRDMRLLIRRLFKARMRTPLALNSLHLVRQQHLQCSGCPAGLCLRPFPAPARAPLKPERARTLEGGQPRIVHVHGLPFTNDTSFLD
jgi:hypothetical protein